MNDIKWSKDLKRSLANIKLYSSKSFDNLNISKIINIFEIFNNENIFLDFNVTDKYQSLITEKLCKLSYDCVSSIRGKIRRISCRIPVKEIVNIIMLMKEFGLEEVIFFHPDKLSWEQFLMDGSFEDKFYLYDTTNALFVLNEYENSCDIIFRTDKYNYSKLLQSIEEIWVN